jgi:maltooligosyltrehalose trehalohydrolase
MILYELHVGTFTPEGIFAGIIPRLERLKDLGVNAIELMPVAQFPGERNWGYDGVYLFAVQNSYGGPTGLKHLTNVCHQHGIAVVLDVVYNHTLLSNENQGYYQDFGQLTHLVKSLREGFVYSGQYSPYRQRRHGNSAKDRPAEQFVIFIQNHDQIGNRMLGERLSQIVSFEALKLAAGVLLLSPYIPLLFMGEEYGEEAPFLYFVSHSDPGLIEAVRQGRKEEFATFTWRGEPPDPQSAETFLRSKLQWEKHAEGHHSILRTFYKTLIRFRKEIPALATLERDNLEVWRWERVLFMRRWTENSHIFALYNFSNADTKVHVSLPAGCWHKILDSADSVWHGSGTHLPGQLRSGEAITIRGESIGLYTKTS